MDLKWTFVEQESMAEGVSAAAVIVVFMTPEYLLRGMLAQLILHYTDNMWAVSTLNVPAGAQVRIVRQLCPGVEVCQAERRSDCARTDG